MPTYTSSVSGTASGSSVVAGIQFDITPVGIRFARKYVGESNVPQDIKRHRRQTYDIMRHMGTPVLIKHMFNAQDVTDGIAQPTENFSSIYGQTRNRDPLSHGVGYASVELSDNEWVGPQGNFVVSDTSPGAGYVKAPKYRGYGPGYLIYMIEPDAAQDVFRLDPTGALIKVQSAQAQAPWFPEINDNDLIINVTIDRSGNILQVNERYQAKQTNPVSMRGYGDRRGRREYTEDGGNRYVVNQTFEMTLLPRSNTLQSVETDR